MEIVLQEADLVKEVGNDPPVAMALRDLIPRWVFCHSDWFEEADDTGIYHRLEVRLRRL